MLQKYRSRLHAEPEQLPPDGDRTAGVLFELLRQCSGPEAGLGVIEVVRVPARP